MEVSLLKQQECRRDTHVDQMLGGASLSCCTESAVDAAEMQDAASASSASCTVERTFTLENSVDCDSQHRSVSTTNLIEHWLELAPENIWVR